MSELRVWSNDYDWVIAESAEDAEAALAEMCGPNDEPHEWRPIRGDTILGIHMDDGRGKVEKTAAEWVLTDGRGFLASTEY